MNDTGAAPSETDLAEARAYCGWPQLWLNPEQTSVQLATKAPCLISARWAKVTLWSRQQPCCRKTNWKIF